MTSTAGPPPGTVADDLARGFAPLLELVTTGPVVDATVLDLCRVRIAMLLGCGPEQEVRVPLPSWAVSEDDVIVELGRTPSSSRFDDRQRVALDLAEQFLFDAKDLTAQIEDLRGHFTDEEVFALTVALGLFESHQRRLLVQAHLPVTTADTPTPGSTP